MKEWKGTWKLLCCRGFLHSGTTLRIHSFVNYEPEVRFRCVRDLGAIQGIGFKTWCLGLRATDLRVVAQGLGLRI